MPAAEWLPQIEGRWFCLTLVAGLAADEVFTAFGGTSAEAADVENDGAVSSDSGAPFVRLGSGDGGAFALETASAQGIRPEVLRRLSHRAQSVSVGLAPNDLPRLRWFQNGTMQADLVLNTPERVVGPQAARVTELLDAGLRARLRGFHHRHLLPGGVELAERLIGITVDRAQRAGAQVGGLVLPLLDDPVAPVVARSAEVAAWIEAADDRAVERAVAAQGRRVAADWRLDEHPQVREWIAQLDNRGRPAGDEEPFPLLLRRLASPAHRHGVVGPAADTSIGVRRALQALRLARTLEPREAVALLHTARARRPELLAELQDDLGRPHPDPARIAELNDTRRRKSGDRVRARATAQHLGDPIAPLDDADAAWNWLLPLLPAGVTLTFVEGITPEALLRRLCARLHDIRAVDAGDLNATFDARSTQAQAVAGNMGPWSFALERGAAAVGPHLLETASTETRAVLLQHTGSGAVRFGYAEDGVLVSRFDLLVPQKREGRDPDRFTRTLTQLGITADTDPAPGAEAGRAIQGLYRLGSQVLGESMGEAAARDATVTAPLSWIPPYARGRGTPQAQAQP